jgi:hypothetical protein
MMNVKEKGQKIRKLHTVLLWADKVYRMGKTNNLEDIGEKKTRKKKKARQSKDCRFFTIQHP